jgi:hypothetical protein
MENKWLLQFLDNYNGVSPEAKSLEKELQQNYKGNSYIGWATMERLTYQQDPFATFEVMLSDNGTPLFSAIDTISTFQSKQGKDLNDLVDSRNDRVINFVRVKLTFLDKVFVEDYPIQDKSYQAPKFVDSNDVNKAIQRAKAKVSSRGTGLALKLYEGNDLQFDAPEKPSISKAIPTPVQDVKSSNEIKEIATELVKDYDSLLKGIKEVNAILIKKYNLTLDPADTVETMTSKLSKIPNVELTFTQIKRLAKG